MKFKFNTTLEDHLNYDLYKHKSTKLDKVLGYFLAIVTTTMLLSVIGDVNGFDKIILILFILLFDFAWIFVIPKASLFGVKISTRLKLKLKSEIIKKHILEINEDTINITNINNQLFTFIESDIKSIKEINNNIYIDTFKPINSVAYIIIPFTTFKSEEEKEEFLNLLNNFK